MKLRFLSSVSRNGRHKRKRPESNAPAELPECPGKNWTEFINRRESRRKNPPTASIRMSTNPADRGQMLKSELCVTEIIVRLLMLLPLHWRDQQQAAARLADTGKVPATTWAGSVTCSSVTTFKAASKVLSAKRKEKQVAERIELRVRPASISDPEIDRGVSGVLKARSVLTFPGPGIEHPVQRPGL